MGQLLISEILESGIRHRSLQTENSLVDVLPLGAAIDPAQPLARSLSFLICGEPVPFALPVGITEITVRGQARDSGFGLKNDFASRERLMLLSNARHFFPRPSRRLRQFGPWFVA